MSYANGLQKLMSYIRGARSEPRRLPELDFRSASNEQIASTFIENGCVLLRNFADSQKIERISHTIGTLYAELNQMHVFEQDFLSRGMGSLPSHVLEQKHLQLLETVFASRGYKVFDGGTHARRVSPPAASKAGYGGPLGFHLDAGFHGFSFAVNFWIPFCECGVDAPSLGVVPMGFQELLDYAEFDGKPQKLEGNVEWYFRHFKPILLKAANGDVEANRQIADELSGKLWTPHYRVGDAMMISSFTLHGTYAVPEMTKSREGMELRFIAGDHANLTDMFPHLVPYAGRTTSPGAQAASS